MVAASGRETELKNCKREKSKPQRTGGARPRLRPGACAARKGNLEEQERKADSPGEAEAGLLAEERPRSIPKMSGGGTFC